MLRPIFFRFSAVFGGPGLAIGKLLRYDVRNSGGEVPEKVYGKDRGHDADEISGNSRFHLYGSLLCGSVFRALLLSGRFFDPFIARR